MASPSSITSFHPEAPRIVLVDGDKRTEFAIPPSGLAIGRRAGKDLPVEDLRVSRDHAEIVFADDGGYLLRDLNSRHGTWVNGARVQTVRLKPGDEIRLGSASGPRLVFAPLAGAGREFLSMFSAPGAATTSVPGGADELERLSLFLELARKLEAPGALEDVLVCLIETTLRITGAERGYVFLREDEGLRLAVARNARGEPLGEDETISRSTMRDALASVQDFVFGDTSAEADAMARQSIIQQALHMVLCIPLRPRRVREEMAHSMMAAPDEALGVLYLDSRTAAGKFSALDSGLVRAVSNQAANLVENARLAASERESRRMRQELAIAAEIQRRLQPADWPQAPGLALAGHSLPCQHVGGDFFDAVAIGPNLYAALVDVSGKGVSAALLASSLQGLLYAQILSGSSLAEAAAAANRYLCQRIGGEKYATGVLVSIEPSGRLHYVNCGHVEPLLVRGDQIQRLSEGGFPVGLIPTAEYAETRVQLNPGDRLLLVTDGVTEVENELGEFFGEARLEAALASGVKLEDLLSLLDGFRGAKPMRDDCTTLEIRYFGG